MQNAEIVKVIQGANFLLGEQKKLLLKALNLEGSGEEEENPTWTPEEAEELLEEVFRRLFGFGLNRLETYERREIDDILARV